MKVANIHTVFHYVPFLDSQYWILRGRAHGDLPITRMAADCLLCIPLWQRIEPYQQQIVDSLSTYYY